ncbi:hypothetical protein BIY29_11845 [Brenneria alni]|uniref:Putative Flp pilus-assembly TadG-like N-terminal domain-containing protein n=1 Tax=Brenneria alni TaxID=71656 RepID=A0A421DMR5_9GAMM|nr:TadE/TadG family type IV pilus assembly protein [Brenneria alni]RLM22676.1 hypothetical protein BIY29_11845 [Brenneria alni]
MTTLRLFFLSLLREQRGAVTMTYLLCFPVILLALLGSIDFIRYSMAQDKLQNALDAAVISAGRNLEKFTPQIGSGDESESGEQDGWRIDASSYFRSNMPEGFLDSQVPLKALKITYDEEKTGQGTTTGQLVQMSVSGTLPLLITGMMDRTAFTLSATNEAVRRTRSDLEMVLALDNTGSMSGEDRIGKLKIAATELVDTLLGAAQAGQTAKKAFIGIVPFADTVYVGKEKAHWLSPKAQQFPYIKTGSHWGGCVVEPYIDNTFKAESGLPGHFEPLMTVGSLTIDSDFLKKKLDSNAEYSFDTATEPQAVTGERLMWAEHEASKINIKFAFNSHYEQYGQSRYNCPSNREMIFLTNNADWLKQQIKAMEVDGRTIIPLGLLWSWRMLDANWRGDAGWGDSEKPLDAAIGLNKIIVLLTDGNNGLDPMDPNNNRYRYDDVAIDSKEKGTGDFKIKFDYKVNDGTIGTYDYSDKVNNIVNDKNFINKYYANSSDFSSLRVGPTNELKKSSVAIEPYGQLYQGRRNNQSDWLIGNDTLNELTKELCENIKNKDKNKAIKIYTVILGSGTNANTKKLMQDCSSGADKYYDASNVNNLSAAFRSIANSLTELRLSK